MGALRWTALLLLAMLLRGEGGSGSFHSLRYFYTAVSEPGPGMPSFVVVDHVDGQVTTRYDSNTKKKEPRALWMEKVIEDDPHYWDWETGILQGWEAVSRVRLATLRERYNQSGGLHTLQVMYGCDLNVDVLSGGYQRDGYDGRDFITFHKEALTWMAPDAAALRRWEAETAMAQHWKNYLVDICIDDLRKYLRYGNQTLHRKEPPAVKVTHKDSQEGLETLLCQAHGFYPKEIDITWRKDREARHEDTFHGVVSPNADGTYYTWLSIEIDPKDRSHFQCHVEHEGLQDPLDLNVEESGSAWLIGVGVATVVLLVLVGAGICIYVKKHQKKPAYRPTSSSDQGSDSSTRASPPPGV